MRPFISLSCSREDDRLVSSARVPCSLALMRPFVSLSCSREDDRLVGKRLVRVLKAPEENATNILPELSLGSCRSRGHPSGYSQTQPSAQSAATSPADLPAQRMRTQVPAAAPEPCYCQHAECLRQVRRWQAARRQAKRRRDARVKTQHAQAEKERRRRAKVAPKAMENPKLAPARGHAAENFFLSPYAIGQAATNPP